MITGTSTPTAFLPEPQPPLPPAPSGNPLWGSRAPPQTDVIMFDRSITVQGSGVRGGVGQLTRRWPTRDGHSPPGQQLPKECRPSSDTERCPCRPLGPPATVTPGRLLVSPASPHKGRTRLATQPLRHDTAAGPQRGVVEVVVVVVRTARLDKCVSPYLPHACTVN